MPGKRPRFKPPPRGRNVRARSRGKADREFFAVAPRALMTCAGGYFLGAALFGTGFGLVNFASKKGVHVLPSVEIWAFAVPLIRSAAKTKGSFKKICCPPAKNFPSRRQPVAESDAVCRQQVYQASRPLRSNVTLAPHLVGRVGWYARLRRTHAGPGGQLRDNGGVMRPAAAPLRAPHDAATAPAPAASCWYRARV
jgi:hypothetical protein